MAHDTSLDRSTTNEAIELSAEHGSTSLDAQPTGRAPDDGSAKEYPRGVRLIFIIIGLVLSMFLAALDQTILATAIPSITDEFGNISNIAWYGSSYVITTTAFQATWGKAYKYFNIKLAYFLSIAFFELGNTVCATAPNSTVLILGRIIAGIGGGGLQNGVFIMMALTVKPDRRAAFMGIIGFTYGIASVAGPLMGGALTDGPGWRWCFWINLPIGFIAAMTMFFAFRTPVQPAEASIREKLIQMDFAGGVLATGALSSFVLAIHGAAEYGWKTSRPIGGFTGFGILLICFLVNEWWMSEKAMIQAHLLKNRRILSNLLFIFFIAGAFFPLIYTLPVQFQTVNSKSASESGVMLIPLVLGISVWTMFSNGALTFWRHYKPFLVVGAVLATAGNVNIYTLDTTTSSKAWIGSLILSATGIGLALQMPMISNQASVGVEDLAAVTAITFFLENTGITLFVSSAEASFTMGLVSSLAKNVPNIDPHAVVQAGATQTRALFQSTDLEKVLESYLDGCRTSHLISVSCASAACLVAFTGAGSAIVQEFRLRMKKIHAR